MTTQYRGNKIIECEKCGHENWVKQEEPFEAWIRAQPTLDSYSGFRRYDGDIFFWNKNTGKFAILSKKTYGTEFKFNGDEISTYKMLARGLKFLNGQSPWLNFVGLYAIRFSGSCPTDSEEIKMYEWDGSLYWAEKAMTEGSLLGFLESFGEKDD